MLKHTDTSLLSELKNIQRAEGRLTSAAIAKLAEHTGISESRLWGIASFYSLLSSESKGDYVIRLCSSISCYLCGCEKLLEAAEKMLRIRRGMTTMDGMFTLETVSCLGACGSGPAAMINDRLYTGLDAEKLSKLITDIRYGKFNPSDSDTTPETVSVIGQQALTGEIPDLAVSSYSPLEILEAIDMSGLRGRGGAAFPTGRKWRLCAETPSEERFVVCNADEGEPGTFKDHYLLTQKPELLLMGMALAGRAVGAHKGYIYLRGEYTNAEAILERELSRRKEPSFDIEIITGAGAYVCGEETSLLESMEGKRGVPRLRPPYPPVAGLFGKPTIINNVETLACVPLIIANGPQWYKSIGTPASPGTKLFCVSGDVDRPGIIEAPLGTWLERILAEAGVGRLKAALVGGASGRIIPVEDFERSICYEDLSPGSGAIIAIGTDRSIRDVAINLMTFFEHESCGECVPCRVGTARAREVLCGEPRTERPLPDVLSDLCGVLRDGARCGLGQTATVALMDALRLFPQEFE